MRDHSTQGGLLDAGRFWAGMVLDPVGVMQRMGTATAQAKAMSISLSPSRPRQMFYVTGARHVAPIYLDPTRFRTSSVPPRAPGGGAQARLRRGLIGAQGAEHKHYRAAFQAQTGPAMLDEFAGFVGRHADDALRGLPDDAPIDIVGFVNDLVRHYSIAGMYRDSDAAAALGIGRAITEWLDLAYAPGAQFFPVRLRGTPYARFMDASEALEAAILDWTARRGDADPQRDLLSRFVNGPDEAGLPLTPERMVGHVTHLFAASF